MRVSKVTLFKFEEIGTNAGALTLLDSQGNELESALVNFDGQQYSNLGFSVKALIQRAEYLK